MSRYAYLVCPATKLMIWLGKAVFEVSGEVASASIRSFHIGPPDDPPNHGRELLNRVLWRFLAEHAGMNLRVVVEGDGFAIDDFIEIGGDAEGDVPFDEYLRGRGSRAEDRDA